MESREKDKETMERLGSAVQASFFEKGIALIQFGKAPRSEALPNPLTTGKTIAPVRTETDQYTLACTDALSLRASKDQPEVTLFRMDTDRKNKEEFTTFCYRSGENDSFVLTFALREGDRVYGLGEDNDVAFGRLDRRGTQRDMITGQRINQNHVTADFPIPFLLIVRKELAYAVYIENTWNLQIDVGKTDPRQCIIHAPGGPCRFYCIVGSSVPQIIERYTGLIGRAKLPPLWVLGYMQSKCSFWNWEEIDDVIQSFLEKRIPLDSIVFDFDWAQHFNNYQWNDRWRGLSPDKIKAYREKHGIHFIASNSGPMLKKDSDTYESAVRAGILAKDENGKNVICGHYSGDLMDFTNPATEDWLEPQISRIMDDGIEGWWLDLTEPEGDAENTAYYIGRRAEIHNLFSNYTSRAYHSIMKKHAPNERSFVLTRTGVAGIQQEPTALWTGDIYSEYGTLKAHIPEALNTGLSGIPMWTCDTGGFLSPTNNTACPYNLYHNDRVEHGQLFERWMQFSCFTPIMRAHHAGGESVPFRYQEIMTDGMAHYIRLRYRLIPYLYSLYRENYIFGAPIMRPFFWHDPADEKAYDISDEYLLGENMLIAPVLEAQASAREVYFPAGKWYDFDYGYLYEGGKSEPVFAPQNRIPVFVRAGGIIPMSRDAANTSEIDFSKTELTVWPEGSSRFTLYADDGHTDNYLNGDFTETEIISEEQDEALYIKISRDNDRYPLKETVLHIHMKRPPAQVLFAGYALPCVERLTTVRNADENVFWFDRFNRLLHVRLFLKTRCAELKVQLESEPFEDFLPFDKTRLCGQLPYIYPPASVPCVLQAIHYDRGGKDIAYHKKYDVTTQLYRDDNAGIVFDESVRRNVIGSLEDGEWLAYTISSPTDAVYRIKATCRTQGKAKVKVFVDMDESDPVSISQAVWQEAVLANLRLPKGEHVLRVSVLAGSMDFDTFHLEPFTME